MPSYSIHDGPIFLPQNPIGSPVKLGNVGVGQFVVIDHGTWVAWDEIFFVSMMPDSFFGHDQKHIHWGQRVLVKKNGEICKLRNSVKVRPIFDVNNDTFTSTAVEQEKAKAAAQKKEREEKDAADRRKKEACDELINNVDQFRVTVFNSYDDMQKEMDRVIDRYYQATKVQRLIFHGTSLNFADLAPWYRRNLGENANRVFRIEVKDRNGNLMPDVGSVELFLRGE